MRLPFLDVKSANAFELADLFARKHADLSYAVSITLLKTRLLLDVTSLRNSALLCVKVPQEVLNIRAQLVRTIVVQNKDIMDSKGHTLLIELRSQVQQLYAAVKKSNNNFLPTLLQQGANLTHDSNITT